VARLLYLLLLVVLVCSRLLLLASWCPAEQVHKASISH
jgi:hypothetical protein